MLDKEKTSPPQTGMPYGPASVTKPATPAKRATSRRTQTMAKPKPPEPMGIESFLIANFGKAPRWARGVTYTAVTLAYVYNAVQDPMVRGQLYVKSSADSAERPAVSNIVEFGDAEFSANAQGRWVLRAPRLAFGRMTLTVYEPRDHAKLGSVDVCLPIPIVGSVLPPEQPRIVYREDTKTFSVVPACHSGVREAHAAETRTSTRAASLPESRRVAIQAIQLHATGHTTKPAQVYFVVKQGTTAQLTPGLPSRNRADGWLLLQDDRLVSPNGLWFDATSSTAVLRIEMWNRNPGPFGSDALVATFDLPVSAQPPQGRPMALIDRGTGSRIWVVVN